MERSGNERTIDQLIDNILTREADNEEVMK